MTGGGFLQDGVGVVRRRAVKVSEKACDSERTSVVSFLPGVFSDGGRYAPQIGKTVGILKMVHGRNEHVLSALEKKGLDRKINHQDLMKAEMQPRLARQPPWREKLQSTGMHERSFATVEMSIESAQQRFNVVTCNLCKGTRIQSKKGVKNFHLCLQHSSCFN